MRRRVGPVSKSTAIGSVAEKIGGAGDGCAFGIRHEDYRPVCTRGRCHFCHFSMTRWETPGVLRHWFRMY